jgi:hypothetical protein
MSVDLRPRKQTWQTGIAMLLAAWQGGCAHAFRTDFSESSCPWWIWKRRSLFWGPWQADNRQQLWPICLVVGQVTSWYASLANLAKYEEDVSAHHSGRLTCRSCMSLNGMHRA